MAIERKQMLAVIKSIKPVKGKKLTKASLTESLDNAKAAAGVVDTRTCEYLELLLGQLMIELGVIQDGITVLTQMLQENNCGEG